MPESKKALLFSKPKKEAKKCSFAEKQKSNGHKISPLLPMGDYAMDASESPARNVGIVGAGRQGWRSGEIGAAAEAAGGGLGTMGNLADALADGAGDEEELEDFEELEE